MTTYRFGHFELRPETGELLRAGERVSLQPQPQQILALLLARPGELVTRAELISALWGEAACSDVEHGLNIAVKKLREALGDSADQPAYVETIPRRGYRFIGAVSVTNRAAGQRPAGNLAPAHSSLGRLRLIGLGAVALLICAVAWKSMSVPPNAAGMPERMMVLVGQFSNLTGEPDLDGLVESALETELAASPFVAIVPQDRASDALRLMRQPVLPRIPLPLAREMCMRDPAIRAAVAGAVRRVGSGYLLVAEVLRPGDSGTTVPLSEAAAGKDEILAAIRRLSSGVRNHLGAEVPAVRPAEDEYEPVTTSSWQAFRLYSDANALGKEGKWAAAEVALRKALEIDPEFASAHLLLAWTIRNLRLGPRVDSEARSRPEFLPHARRALDLVASTSQREQLFIRASYLQLLGDLEGATPVYEALVRAYPDHPWAEGNLERVYARTMQWDRLWRLKVQLINMRPNWHGAYFGAASASFCLSDRDLQKIPGYLDRAVELARQSDSPDTSTIETAAPARKAALAWVQGDVDRCKLLLDQSRAMEPIRGGSMLLAQGYLTLGMLRDAEETIQRITHKPARAMLSAWQAYLAGDQETLSKLASSLEPPRPLDGTLFVLLRSGQVESAVPWIERNAGEEFVADLAARKLLQGELAFRRGRLEEAIRLLMPVVESHSDSFLTTARLGALTLAKALAARGQLEQAVAVLEKASAHPGCGYFEGAMYWLQIRYQLMLLYRDQKRFAGAEAIRNQLMNYLRYADSTSTLRAALENPGIELKRRAQTVNAQTGKHLLRGE